MNVNHKDRLARIGRASYPMRVLGFVLFSLSIYLFHSKQGLKIDFWGMTVIVFALIYPHLAYLRYLKKRRSEIELQHMLFDMGLQGIMAAFVNFNPMISLPFLIASSVTNYALRGVKQSIKGVSLAIVMAILIGLSLNKEIVLDAEPIEMILPLFYLIVRTHYMAYIAYLRGIVLVRHRKKAEALAKLDFLTGLGNRRSMFDQVKINDESRHPESDNTTLMMIDLDYFKQLNDQYGHDHGDQALVLISEILKNSIRDSDFVARWGGEEFLVLLPNTPIKQGLIIAEDIREKIAKHHFKYNDIDHHITATFGVASYGVESNFVETLKHADQALYDGKQQGRNCVITVGV